VASTSGSRCSNVLFPSPRSGPALNVGGRSQPGTPDPAYWTNNGNRPPELLDGTTRRDRGAAGGVDAGRPREDDLRPVGMNLSPSSRILVRGAQPAAHRCARVAPPAPPPSLPFSAAGGRDARLPVQAAPSRAPHLGRGLKTYRKFSPTPSVTPSVTSRITLRMTPDTAMSESA